MVLQAISGRDSGAALAADQAHIVRAGTVFVADAADVSCNNIFCSVAKFFVGTADDCGSCEYHRKASRKERSNVTGTVSGTTGLVSCAKWERLQPSVRMLAAGVTPTAATPAPAATMPAITMVLSSRTWRRTIFNNKITSK